MTAAPRFVVCEDGREYVDRFERLLGDRFGFVHTTNGAEARAAAASGAVGLLFDLDFRRTPGALLVNEAGEQSAACAGSERARLSAIQGILILRALRRAGVALPALLFADLDDREQVSFLEGDLAPLRVIPSSAGLHEIAQAFDRIARGENP